jgi:biotin carboxyl carrier protein
MGNYDDIFGESGFIKRSPNWILRWGLTLVTVFFLAIIILSFIVKYNEVLTADVVITSKSPIIKLATKQNGILLYQSINSGDTINAGKVLGIIENNGNLDDIVFLSNKLNKSPETNEFKFLEDLFSKNLKVGSIIMPSYNAFLNAYNQYSLNAFFKYDSLKSHGLIEQFNKQNLGLSNKKAVISAMENELELSKQNYERYGNLFEKGVISKMDLEEREKEYLIKQQNLSRLKEEQVGLTQVMSNTQFEQQYIKVEEKSNNIKLANELAISKQELITAIEKWKDLYLIVSPVKGKLFYDNQWSNYQNVKEGDVIYTILPLEEGEIIARCEVPFYNSSKLQKTKRP